MKRYGGPKRVEIDQATLQASEEMRLEILHEIQEGWAAPDDLVDVAGNLAMLDNPWPLAKPPSTHVIRAHVN